MIDFEQNKMINVMEKRKMKLIIGVKGQLRVKHIKDQHQITKTQRGTKKNSVVLGPFIPAFEKL